MAERTISAAASRPWSFMPGFSAGRPGGVSERNNVRVFTAKGLSAPGVLGTFPLPQIGTLIPGTPYIYIRPRLSQDDLGGVGGSTFINSGAAARSDAVIRTNPAYAFYRERRRTPSIGMNAALSMGATMGVPYSNEGSLPFFSVA